MEPSDRPGHPSSARLSASSLFPSSIHSAVAYEWSQLSFPNNNRGARFMTPPLSASPSPCPTPGLSRGSTPSISPHNFEIEIEELPESYQSGAEVLHGEFEEPSPEPEEVEDAEEVHLIHGLSQLSAKSISPIPSRWRMPTAIPENMRKKRAYVESIDGSDDDYSDGAIDSDYSASSDGGRIRRRKIAGSKLAMANDTTSRRYSHVFDMDLDL